MKKLIALFALTFFLGMGTSFAQSGVIIWSQRCGNCHAIQPAVWYTKERWEAILMHMRIYAHLTDEQAEAVLEFLKTGAYRAEKNRPWHERIWARVKKEKTLHPMEGK